MESPDGYIAPRKGKAALLVGRKKGRMNMLWNFTGILVVLWLLGMIVSCTSKGPVLIVFLIASVFLLLSALILVQIIKKKEKR